MKRSVSIFALMLCAGTKVLGFRWRRERVLNIAKALCAVSVTVSLGATAGWEERSGTGWGYGPVYCVPDNGVIVPGAFDPTNFAPPSSYYPYHYVGACEVTNANAHPSWVRSHQCEIRINDASGDRPLCGAAASVICPIGYEKSGPPAPQLGMCYRDAGASCAPGMVADANQICRTTACVAPMIRGANGTCQPPPQNKQGCPKAQGKKRSCNPDQLPTNAGNPISFTSGAKTETEVDYQAGGDTWLTFIRYYDSQSPSHAGRTDVLPLGNKWSHNYSRRLELLDDGRIAAMRGDGRVIYMNRSSGTTYQQWFGEDDTNESVTRGTNGYFYYQAADGSVETYFKLWQLNEITYLDGRVLQLSYDYYSGRLTSVFDHFYRRLTFAYIGNRIASITLPNNTKIQYEYTGDELTGVVYPDGIRKTYQYTSLTIGGALEPSLLTDIIDENGTNYAHWTYDSTTGFAKSSEHAGGVNKYQISYTNDANGQPQSVVVTNPLGAQSTFSLTRVLGVGQPVSEFNTALGESRSQTFDARGNLTSTTDYKGNITTYSYDMTRNLETKRVQAFGTANALTTTTEWHSYWRLPLRVAEPGKLTSYVYNGDTYAGSPVNCTTAGYTRITKIPQMGLMPAPVICKRIEQNTTDMSGNLGFNASLQGMPRNVSYTYGVQTNLLTVDGPRTDINDVTRMVYYNTGALPKSGMVSTITNSLGHVTTFNNYDAHGRPLSITDPNGITTTLTYDLRGRLKTRTVSGEVTSYQYDPVGQMTKVTLPDGSFIAYTYDAAHRLTDITDSLGNTIHYTLDAMGNRTKDETRDPLGTLSQQTTRVYDALNRLQTLTGAQE